MTTSRSAPAFATGSRVDAKLPVLFSSSFHHNVMRFTWTGIVTPLLDRMNEARASHPNPVTTCSPTGNPRQRSEQSETAYHSCRRRTAPPAAGGASRPAKVLTTSSRRAKDFPLRRPVILECRRRAAHNFRFGWAADVFYIVHHAMHSWL